MIAYETKFRKFRKRFRFGINGKIRDSIYVFKI